MSKVAKVTDATFEQEVLQSDKPVLLDFWAEWCGPCRQMAPVLDELAEELEGVKIVKMNIEESPETPTKYGVRGIPTFVLFNKGEAKAVKVGGMPKAAMASWVKESL